MRRLTKLTTLSLLCLLTIACASNRYSDKPEDINRYIRQLERKPHQQKYAERLKIAYETQISKILSEVKIFEDEKKPFYQEEVLSRYKTLNEMAARINECVPCRNAKLPVLFKKEEKTSLDKAISDRMEAGKQALNHNTKEEAQIAYGHFLKVRQFTPQKNEVDVWLNDALEKGTVRVFLEGDYTEDKAYVKDIEKDLLKKLRKSKEAKPFYLFYNRIEEDTLKLKYDWVVRFGYKYLTVGFEQRSCSDETFSADIKVGERKIDSVRVEPIYEKATASVTKCRKSVKAEGSLWFEIVDLDRNEVILKDNCYEDDNWVNEWVSVSGDSRALPVGVSNSGSENSSPTRWTQFDNTTSGLTSTMAFRIRKFITKQSTQVLKKGL